MRFRPGFVAASVALIALALNTASGQRLHFVVYGDSRGGHVEHRKLVALIAAEKPAFVMQTGDMVARGSDPDLWKIYDDITKDLRAKTTIYPARGNHDVGGPGFEDHVPPNVKPTKLYYSFDRSRCHFVVIDNFSDAAPESPQTTWLQTDLEQAQKSAKHIFVFFHESPYSVGPHGDNKTAQRQWVPLFQKYGVRIVFTGHDHIYYRTVRDGMNYVVTGGGGAPLYPVHKDRMHEGDVGESVYHYIVVDIRGKSVKLTVYGDKRNQLDQFTVTAP